MRLATARPMTKAAWSSALSAITLRNTATQLPELTPRSPVARSPVADLFHVAGGLLEAVGHAVALAADRLRRVVDQPAAALHRPLAQLASAVGRVAGPAGTFARCLRDHLAGLLAGAGREEEGQGGAGDASDQECHEHVGTGITVGHGDLSF